MFCSLPLAAQAPQAAATEMLGGHLVVSHRVLFAFNSAPSATAVAEIKSVTGAAAMRPVGGAGAYLIDSNTLDTADLVAYHDHDLRRTSSYQHYWNADRGQDSAQLAPALASDINSDPFRVVTAQVTNSGPGSATVAITSIAKGPWTAFATDATNTDSCTPPSGGSCAPDPWNVTISYAGGPRP